MILIIFDVDGTLTHSESRDSLCFANTYEKVFKRKFPTINWHKYPHVTDTVIFETVIQEHFKRKPGQEELEDFHNQYSQNLINNRKENPEHFMEVPGARELVEHINSLDGFQLAIATGGWKIPAEIKLEHIGISPSLMPISGADGQYNREDIVNEAIRLTGQKASDFRRMVYIGDATWDVRTTRNLNMNFIGIRMDNDHEVLQQAGASHVVSNYLDREHFINLVHEAVPPIMMDNY